MFYSRAFETDYEVDPIPYPVDKAGIKKNKSPVIHAAITGLLFGSLRRDSLMGEEKPDEELMGKRKSSPRLSTTFIDVDISRMPGCCLNIPYLEKNLGAMRFHFSYMG